jgi:hypothetical protein
MSSAAKADKAAMRLKVIRAARDAEAVATDRAEPADSNQN